MLTPEEIRQKLTGAFNDVQTSALTEVLKGVFEARVVDLSDLKDAVKELAVAQQRTEERLERLAAAQQRTEERLERLEEAVQNLALAQRRTEEHLQELIDAHAETRRQLGGLTATVGYTLENEAYKALPALLKRDAGLVVQDRLTRTYVTDNEGHALELNIFGKARKNGQEVVIVGESKTQLSHNDVDRFFKRKLDRLRGKLEGIFPVLVTHMTSGPDVEVYAKEKGVAVYFSYDF